MPKPAFLLLASATIAAQVEGVRVDVTVGRVPVTDWIVEQQRYLSAMARLLDLNEPAAAEDVRVHLEPLTARIAAGES